MSVNEIVSKFKAMYPNIKLSCLENNNYRLKFNAGEDWIVDLGHLRMHVEYREKKYECKF